MYAQLTTHIKGDLSAQKASIFWRATGPREEVAIESGRALFNFIIQMCLSE